MKILLTRDAGCISSHAFVALCGSCIKPVILDNICNIDQVTLTPLTPT